MDFLAVALRHAVPQVREYLPYAFTGTGWLPVEKNILKAAVDPHIPDSGDPLGKKLVGPTFNNWLFSKYGPGPCYARRATWDMGGLNGDTAQKLADKIAEYYSRA